MEIPFCKYTAYGNNFVIVDEMCEPVFSESGKSAFAYHATNTYFGIGSDNFLVVQPSKPKILQEINRNRQYWKIVPDFDSADFLFRMFEPDGAEAFSCGNGLLCVAKYLYEKHGIQSARMMTEIPMKTPAIITIGTHAKNGMREVNMGWPVPISESIVRHREFASHEGGIDRLTNMAVRFRKHDLAPFTDDNILLLSGHIIHTGEPHFVIFPENGFSHPQLADVIFAGSHSKDESEKRVNFGSWLVSHIGMYLNTNHKNDFPAGLNVGFARLVDKETLEYRCFERGIDRETLACGTGAVAAAYIMKKLDMVRSGQMTVLPYLCRQYDPNARILVRETENGWVLMGNPQRVFDGIFNSQPDMGLADGR